jgi:hypothetical protein
MPGVPLSPPTLPCSPLARARPANGRRHPTRRRGPHRHPRRIDRRRPAATSPRSPWRSSPRRWLPDTTPRSPAASRAPRTTSKPTTRWGSVTLADGASSDRRTVVGWRPLAERFGIPPWQVRRALLALLGPRPNRASFVAWWSTVRASSPRGPWSTTCARPPCGGATRVGRRRSADPSEARLPAPRSRVQSAEADLPDMPT